MKAVLNIVAAVLIAAGLVVAVASLLTPGQVIYGIDFRLAATLVVGGLILLALARALALLERMSNDLRQLRKAGSEAPPWLRQAAGQSGIQAAAAMAMAEGAAPVEAARQGPGGEPAQEVGHHIGGDIGEQPATTAEAEWPHATETEWPQASEVQWPEAPESEQEPETPGAEAPTSPEAETPEPAREEETELPFLGAPAPAEQDQFAPERGFEPKPEPKPAEPVASASWVDSEPGPIETEDDAEVPGETEPADAASEDYPGEPSEPHPAETEDAAVAEDAEMPRRLRPSQYKPWTPEEPAEADEEPQAPQAWEQASEEQAPEEQDQFFEADAPETQASEEPSPDEQSSEDLSSEELSSEEQPSEDPAALYVVEERMFRGKQARVLSDGTVEAETAEGWMRFEDFDHLEEYLDAMAELGR